jgi:hypothetical protein
MRIQHVCAAVIVLAVAARSGAGEIPAETKTALEKAAEWELYSLDPEYLKEPPKDGFHGWKVLGKTTVKDADTRKALLAALEKGAKDNDGVAAKCFDPRHGIRIKAGDQTIDLVICFACYQTKVFAGDKPTGGYLTTNSPQPALDKVLTDAKVPLPKGRD